MTAAFVSPGEGHQLDAVASIVHQGRETAVVRTVVSGLGGRRVLEVLSTHARK